MDNISNMPKDKKICLVVKSFLKNPTYTMLELSELPELKGISKSSIQRYLNDSLIISIFGRKTYEEIQELLKNNISNARKKGGINSFKNNEPIKDDKGKFISTFKTKDNHRLEKKINHILVFSNIFISNPNMSLNDIVNFYNGNNPYGEVVTRDYVYDCLSCNGSYNLLDDNIKEKIRIQLEARSFNNPNVVEINRRKK